jgi:hypothetical protein
MPKKSANPKPRVIVPAPILIDPNKRYSISVANELLDQSNSKTYEDIAAGRLKVLKDGRRSYIHGSEIIRRSAVGLETPLSVPPVLAEANNRAICNAADLVICEQLVQTVADARADARPVPISSTAQRAAAG